MKKNEVVYHYHQGDSCNGRPFWEPKWSAAKKAKPNNESQQIEKYAQRVGKDGREGWSVRLAKHTHLPNVGPVKKVLIRLVETHHDHLNRGL